MIVNVIGVLEDSETGFRGRNLPRDAYHPLTIPRQVHVTVRVTCYHASGVPLELTDPDALTVLTVKRTARDDQKWVRKIAVVTAAEPNIAIFSIVPADTRPVEWTKGLWEVVYVAPDATLWQVIPPSAFTMAPTLNPNPP